MRERDYWLWLTRVPGLGPKRIKHLLSIYRTPYGIYEASEDQMKETMSARPFDRRSFSEFCASKDEKRIVNYTERLNALGITYMTVDDEEYPKALFGLYEPIYVLYCRGTFSEKNLNIGVVGARQCTPYGGKVAERFAGDLAVNGVNIISGMARGIDSHSHWGALKAFGTTTAVLGSGINVCYPSSNQKLMREIIAHGCVLSEYGLDMQPSKSTFPLRNRIISALSDGVLLVEAKRRSGSLITVDYALEYGKDVYAVPGDVLGSTNEGSNNIIRLGAKPVFCAKDILEEYSIYSNNRANCSVSHEKILEEKEKIVYSCISLSPIFVDELAVKTGFSMNELQFLLTKLEIKGAVIQLPNKHYIREC